MKFEETEFIGTPDKLNELVREKRKEGLKVKVKHAADLSSGERKYKLKMRKDTKNTNES